MLGIKRKISAFPLKNNFFVATYITLTPRNRLRFFENTNCYNKSFKFPCWWYKNQLTLFFILGYFVLTVFRNNTCLVTSWAQKWRQRRLILTNERPVLDTTDQSQAWKQLSRSFLPEPKSMLQRIQSNSISFGSLTQITNYTEVKANLLWP